MREALDVDIEKLNRRVRGSGERLRLLQALAYLEEVCAAEEAFQAETGMGGDDPLAVSCRRARAFLEKQAAHATKGVAHG